MRKKIIAGLLILALITISVTFGYMVNQVKTNSVNIVIGNKDLKGATLTIRGRQDAVLIPLDADKTADNETYELIYDLYVETEGVYRDFTIEHNLPEGMYIVKNTEDTIYQSNTTIPLSIKLVTSIDIEEHEFYLWINFK